MEINVKQPIKVALIHFFYFNYVKLLFLNRIIIDNSYQFFYNKSDF